MNNTRELLEAKSRKQYLQEELIKIQNEIDKLLLLNDEYILTRDFDGDNIISIIDVKIITDAVLDNNHSLFYNSINRTYNGKSLDLNDDGRISVTDSQRLIGETLDWIEANVPVDLTIGINTYNKSNFNGTNWIESYCNSHNGEYPTLDELKTAYNNA